MSNSILLSIVIIKSWEAQLSEFSVPEKVFCSIVETKRFWKGWNSAQFAAGSNELGFVPCSWPFMEGLVLSATAFMSFASILWLVVVKLAAGNEEYDDEAEHEQASSLSSTSSHPNLSSKMIIFRRFLTHESKSVQGQNLWDSEYIVITICSNFLTKSVHKVFKSVQKLFDKRSK